jgi:hypothetical protein
VVDGIEQNCDSVGSEAAAQCPDNDCGPRFNPNRDGKGRAGWETLYLTYAGFSYQPLGPSTRASLAKPTLKTVSTAERARRKQFVQEYGRSGFGDEDDGLSSPQKRSDTSGDKDIKPPNVAETTVEISDCVRRVLGQFFDSRVFDGVRIHTDGLPIYVPAQGTGAFTGSRGDIYYPRGEYNPHTIIGIAAIAHELVHIMQWRKYGSSFGALYLGESAGQAYQKGAIWAYWGNRFEVPAAKRETEIASALTAIYGGKDPCPKNP